MKRTAILTAVLSLALLPALAGAAVVNPIMDFNEGYAAEGARTNGDHTSNIGDELVIIGFVEAFNEPFDDLDPNDATKEYTFVYSGLISGGTVAVPLGPFTQWTTDYTGGTIRVYCDPAMDADYSNPASFANGDMILEGTFSSFSVETDNTDGLLGCSGNVGGSVLFTGGSLSGRLDGACEGAIVGQFSVCSVTYNPPAGFVGFGSGQTKLDANCPTPVENKTWGAIKSLYQD
jgi:hypothetical protein